MIDGEREFVNTKRRSLEHYAVLFFIDYWKDIRLLYNEQSDTNEFHAGK
jgi:hypothetical protein